jgi:hypothetical protein
LDVKNIFAGLRTEHRWRYSSQKNSKEGGAATSHLPSRVSTFKGVLATIELPTSPLSQTIFILFYFFFNFEI